MAGIIVNRPTKRKIISGKEVVNLRNEVVNPWE